MKATVRPNFLPPVQLNFLLRAHFNAVESASWLLHPVAILVPENCRGLSLSLSLTLCFSLSFQLPLSWMSARSFRISLKLDFNPGWLNLWRFGSLRSSVWKLFCRRIPRCSLPKTGCMQITLAYFSSPFFKCAVHGIFYLPIFLHFSQFLHSKKWRLQQDSSLDRRSGRQARWPPRP